MIPVVEKQMIFEGKELFMARDIEAIIRKMTLEEKAGICSGKNTWYLKAVERLGVPSVMVSDGPHGLRKQIEKGDNLGLNCSVKAVCFPAACATAASFSENLLYKLGDALGEECRAEDVAVLLGPAMNIKRSPLCGRNFEYFSEDPYLTGKLAAAQIKGVQKHKVGTSVKHFAANNQEFRRMTCSSEMDERTLREIYLRGFEIAVKEARPWTVMSSYNMINGTYVGESRRLLTDVLRGEWGFDGLVVSDWGAVNERIAALYAGLDLEMPYYDGSGDRKIAEAVRSGALSEKVLDTAVERILKTVFRYVDAELEKSDFDREAHHEIAVDMAKQCAVLLKNNGLLPLGRDQKLAYIGPFAKNPRYQGGGSSHINSYKVTGALETADSQNIKYAEGFGINGEALPDMEIEEAIETAKSADAAVIFAGLPDNYESEGFDREHMRLPESQNELIAKIIDVQPNTVVVLHIGSPVEMPWANDAAAILNMYLGGEGVGEASDALIYGDVNPSGRLPETFPLCLENTPCYLNFPGNGKTVHYNEGIYVGYRYYDAKNMEVLFPFGHGLSYTAFEFSNMTVSKKELKADERLSVTVTVKNTGNRVGTETVQIYASDGSAKFRKLAGFKKVALQPGESAKVEILLDERAFEKYSEKLGDWICTGGEYEVAAAHSSRDIRLKETVNITALKVEPLVVDENTTMAELLEHPATSAAVQKLLLGFRGALQSVDSEEEGAFSSDALHKMALNVPFRGFVSMSLLKSDQVCKLILQMNSLIDNYNIQNAVDLKQK